MDFPEWSDRRYVALTANRYRQLMALEGPYFDLAELRADLTAGVAGATESGLITSEEAAALLDDDRTVAQLMARVIYDSTK